MSQISRNKIDVIIQCLNLSSEPLELPASFADGTLRQWLRVLEWLDESGLALYFLKRLEESNSFQSIPEPILVRLQQRQSKNTERMLRMRQMFALLNRRFNQVGVRYAALKGFSLVPDYCPEASLRLQSDLDYLIDRNSKEAATRILAEQGYVLKMQVGEEFEFSIPGQRATPPSMQYDPKAPFAIELQYSAWDHGANEYPVLARRIGFDLIQVRESQGLLFPALPEQEVFIGQALHAFRHLMNDAVRPSWLLEIGYFLKRCDDNASFWSRMSSLNQSDPMLGEVVGLITGLAAKVFGETHTAARGWTERLNPMLQFWLERYGRECVLESGPGYGTRFLSSAKLVLFLRQRYIAEAHRRVSLLRRALLPAEGLRHLGDHPRSPIGRFRFAAKQCRWFASRLAYHLGSNLRYLWEIPIWYLMNKRTAAHPPKLMSPGRAA